MKPQLTGLPIACVGKLFLMFYCCQLVCITEFHTEQIKLMWIPPKHHPGIYTTESCSFHKGGKQGSGLPKSRYYISWCRLHDMNGDSDVNKLKKKIPSWYQTASCCIHVFHLHGAWHVFSHSSQDKMGTRSKNVTRTKFCSYSPVRRALQAHRSTTTQ